MIIYKISRKNLCRYAWQHTLMGSALFFMMVSTNCQFTYKNTSPSTLPPFSCVQNESLPQLSTTRKHITDCEISPAGIMLLKKFEGFRSQAYHCAAGALTIGYGQTIPGGPTQPVTISEADAQLRAALAKTYIPAVKKAIKVPLYQREFDMLVSLCYNIGGTVFCDPTKDPGNHGQQINLLPLLNTSHYETASLEFPKFTKGDAKQPHYNGLLKRRVTEMFVFRGNALIPSTLHDIITHYEDPSNARLLLEAKKLYNEYLQWKDD